MIYTQEPWEVQNGNGNLGYYIIAKDGDNHVAVAQVFPRGIAGCETKGNALLMKAAPKMHQALKAQHEAIDILFAMLIERDKSFFPSKSGRPWEAIRQGNEALAEVEGKEVEDVLSV